MKTKNGYINITTKSINTDNEDYVIVEGYASTITKDRDGDIVMPVGIQVDNFLKNPIILFNHNRHDIIGKAEKVEIDGNGLYVKVKVFKSLNSTAFSAIRMGVLKTFSIGFRGLDGKYDEETDTFYFLKSELYEISIVSVPANQDAVFDLVETPCGDGFCLADKSFTNNEVDIKSKDETGDNMDKETDVVMESIKEVLQEILSTLKDSSKTVSEDKDAEAEEVKSEEGGDDIAPDKGIEVVASNLAVYTTEDIFTLYTKLEKELNKRIGE